MTEELEQVEETVTEEVTPEAPAAAEPEAPPAAEAKEEFVYDPDWMSESLPEPTPQVAQGPQYSPEQIAAAQYAAQQQQARGYAPPSSEDVLNDFIRDPQGMITGAAGQAAERAAHAMMQQYLAPIQQQTREFIEGQANYHISNADDKIKSIYREKFSKDETFANNKNVQKLVDDAIRGMREQAVWNARRGDPRGLSVFNDPNLAAVTLAAAKIMAGAQPTSVGPASTPHVETTAPSVPKPDIELDPDTEEAIRRFGPEYRERYIQALRDEQSE